MNIVVNKNGLINLLHVVLIMTFYVVLIAKLTSTSRFIISHLVISYQDLHFYTDTDTSISRLASVSYLFRKGRETNLLRFRLKISSLTRSSRIFIYLPLMKCSELYMFEKALSHRLYPIEDKRTYLRDTREWTQLTPSRYLFFTSYIFILKAQFTGTYDE